MFLNVYKQHLDKRKGAEMPPPKSPQKEGETAMTAKEKEIQNFMKKLGLSYEEAEQLWLDDNSDEMTPEQAELSKKAKASGTEKMYINTEKVKNRTSEKVRKVDEQKKLILETLKPPLEKIGVAEINIKTETEISFDLSGSKYTLKLTKHRKEKEGN